MQLSYNHITIEIIYTIAFQDFKSGAIKCNKFKHYEPGAISLVDVASNLRSLKRTAWKRLASIDKEQLACSTLINGI